VTTFSTRTKGAIAEIFTTARNNFRFELSSFDGDKFHYLAWGTVDNHADQQGFCSGTSSEARTHNPWQHSGLDIDYDLSSYYATVDSPAETYTISITCAFAGSHTEQHAFGPLETYAGPDQRPVMQPGGPEAVGHGHRLDRDDDLDVGLQAEARLIRSGFYSGSVSPEPPSSAGKSLSLGSPSFIGRTVDS
jgi:hypothetical protein